MWARRRGKPRAQFTIRDADGDVVAERYTLVSAKEVALWGVSRWPLEIVDGAGEVVVRVDWVP